MLEVVSDVPAQCTINLKEKSPPLQLKIQYMQKGKVDLRVYYSYKYSDPNSRNCENQEDAD